MDHTENHPPPKTLNTPLSFFLLSDNIKEIQAALQAGFQCAVASRPGNAPLPDSCIVNIDDRQFFQTDIDGDYVVLVHIIKSFDELFDLFDQGGGEVEEKREKKFKVVESSDSNLIQHD